jgi:GntR family transcriptional regulator
VTQARADLIGTIKLDPHALEPLHRQLTLKIAGWIYDGSLPAGSPLMGDWEMAHKLGVSRHTVRHALSGLHHLGLVERRRGRGTIVLDRQGPPPIERTLSQFYAFVWEAEARGEEHRSEILGRETVPASAAVALALSIPTGSPVERIRRLRIAGGEPLEIETGHYPASVSAVLDEPALTQLSLYDVLEQRLQRKVSHARESIRAVTLTDSEAALLKVPKRSAAFAVDRTTYSGEMPLESRETILRSDRYRYTFELRNQG